MDGALVDPSQARVSVYDRGFLFGDGVFEVMRTYRRVPFALDEHLARLRRSARLVLIGVPVDDATLRADVELALDAAGAGESYVRVILTRGTGDTVTLDLAVARM